MHINITIDAGGQRFDISIDDRQRICEAAAILKESGRYRGDAGIRFYKSALNHAVVSGNHTFQGCGILDGDLLSAIES
jgi:uncharacterized ubiquitin-like protein YukD